VTLVNDPGTMSDYAAKMARAPDSTWARRLHPRARHADSPRWWCAAVTVVQIVKSKRWTNPAAAPAGLRIREHKCQWSVSRQLQCSPGTPTANWH